MKTDFLIHPIRKDLCMVLPNAGQDPFLSLEQVQALLPDMPAGSHVIFDLWLLHGNEAARYVQVPLKEGQLMLEAAIRLPLDTPGLARQSELLIRDQRANLDFSVVDPLNRHTFKQLLRRWACHSMLKGSSKKPVFRLEDLEESAPRSAQDIRGAFAQGRIAEMTPHQAGQ